MDWSASCSAPELCALKTFTDRMAGHTMEAMVEDAELARPAR
jgi:hypothetical protein